jgi:hypothetical protein
VSSLATTLNASATTDTACDVPWAPFEARTIAR